MNDGPYKLHTGYLVEGLELFIRKVAYTTNDATSTFALRFKRQKGTRCLGVQLDHPVTGGHKYRDLVL
jgi:hypothetical protein